MQTFLPYDDYDLSAAVLDGRRLGKQRVEAYQILRTLTGVSSGWANHPAVKMWRGHEWSLYHYTRAMCNEWIIRGYNDSIATKIDTLPMPAGRSKVGDDPVWMGDVSVHASHRSNLLRKDPKWYSQYGWPEPGTLPYVWPVK